MKKTLTIIGLIIIFFLIYFLQVNFFSWFTIAGVKPNLFVIYVLVIGLFAGKKVGCILGILFGLYIDIINGRIVGISAVMLGAIGFLVEYMDKNVSNDNKITMMLIVAANTVLYELSYYIGFIWKLSVTLEIIPFIKILCIEVFFNIMLTIILYPAIQKFGNYLSELFKKKNFLTAYF